MKKLLVLIFVVFLVACSPKVVSTKNEQQIQESINSFIDGLKDLDLKKVNDSINDSSQVGEIAIYDTFLLESARNDLRDALSSLINIDVKDMEIDGDEAIVHTSLNPINVDKLINDLENEIDFNIEDANFITLGIKQKELSSNVKEYLSNNHYKEYLNSKVNFDFKLEKIKDEWKITNIDELLDVMGI